MCNLMFLKGRACIVEMLPKNVRQHALEETKSWSCNVTLLLVYVMVVESKPT